MAERPVYFTCSEEDKFVEIKNISFNWSAGFAVSQKTKIR